MELQDHIWEQAERFIAGKMTDAERAALATQKTQDATFARDFDRAKNLLQTMQGKTRTEAFRSTLAQIHKAVTQPVKAGEKKRRVIPFMSNWRTAAVAASVAAVISIGSIVGSKTGNKDTARYHQLSREIEAVKRSQKNLAQTQKQLISEVKSVKQSAPVAPFNSTGTAFALNHSGYLITAYHVAKDADSLYIQTRKGENYKASLLAFNPQADVAVLKIEDKDFHFAGGELPYAFATRKSGLGARIYTLGFPQDEVVYSEGYVSAANGYSGDSAQYRLELPSEPGASGAPVVDGAGNVIGIVAGRNNEVGGTTYAIASPELLRLLRSMPKDIRPTLGASTNRLRGLSREQQLDKLQDYTCIVRVYKKG